jgi:hypothetical protein
MIACPSIVLVAWLQSPPAPPPQSPPAAAADAPLYEFPLALAPGDARLIEIKSTTTATLHMVIDGQTIDSKQREENTALVVDTLLDPKSQPGNHVWSGTRRIVKVLQTTDGVPSDPECNGLDADLWSDGKLVHFEIRGDRAVNPKTMDDLMLGIDSFGLGAGIGLPASAKVGEAFDVDFAGLAPWCLGTAGTVEKAVAHLRFEAVEPKTNLAKFRGKAEVEEAIDKSADQMAAAFSLKGRGHYEVDLAIDYDVAAHRLARITCRGNATIEGDAAGEHPAKLTVGGALDTTITNRVGAVVANALKEKPQFRDVPRDSIRAGVSIVLPSHYAKVKPQIPTVDMFQSTLRGTKNYSQVSLFAEDSRSLPLKEFGEAYRSSFLAGLKGSTGKDAKATGGLGAASAFEYTTADVHGLVTIFPRDASHYVVVLCVSPESAWTESSKDWPRIFQSMKKLPAAK